MRPNSAAYSAQTARGTAFHGDTRISAPHAQIAASSPSQPRRGMHMANKGTPFSQEALQGSNMLSPQRLQEAAIHSGRRYWHISTGFLADIEHARCPPALLVVPRR